MINADTDEFFWPVSSSASLTDVLGAVDPSFGVVEMRRDNLVADPTGAGWHWREDYERLRNAPCTRRTWTASPTSRRASRARPGHQAARSADHPDPLVPWALHAVTHTVSQA
ncbi:hypothetical protein C8D88_105434 [Lentzea atacamensis]|uniref:Uncharacterized protein n=1 Tax=Lentzea atacamensis TaxID=531938 RepID=A0A316I7I0_9PSEU|nr:hypothetical protein [Lentzea atacamensis]PWK86385.1 hypothetical protein C8D88_105434 [Lentzea atacamensis]